MTFLEARVSFQSASKEGFTFIYNKTESMLKDIEATNIYIHYFYNVHNMQCCPLDLIYSTGALDLIYSTGALAN